MIKQSIVCCLAYGVVGLENSIIKANRMKKLNIILMVVIILSSTFPIVIEAKRPAPKEVKPVIYNRVKYTATHETNMGCIGAWDVKTGKKLWELKVYEIKYVPGLERDVQDVFITSLSIKEGKLIVLNEADDAYEVDLETRDVKKSTWVNKAPDLYANENRQLIKNSYKEKWVKSSVEKHAEAVQKAKEVLKEWGQNSDKYEYRNKVFDYEISVFESPHFVSVTFLPVGMTETCHQVEIRMKKKSLKVLSILPGP